MPRKLSPTPPPPPTLSPAAVAALGAFSALMREELLANVHKGDRPDWRRRAPMEAALDVAAHTGKLSRALLRRDPDEIREHAVDVACCAMVLLDAVGVLDLDVAPILPREDRVDGETDVRYLRAFASYGAPSWVADAAREDRLALRHAVLPPPRLQQDATSVVASRPARATAVLPDGRVVIGEGGTIPEDARALEAAAPDLTPPRVATGRIDDSIY